MVSAYGANKDQVKALLGDVGRVSRKKKPIYTSTDSRFTVAQKQHKSNLRKKFIGHSTNMDIMDIHVTND